MADIYTGFVVKISAKNILKSQQIKCMPLYYRITLLKFFFKA